MATKLHTVKDTNTNWTAKEWQILERMKKNYAEMDEKSGRPWKLGDDLLLLDPPGAEGVHSGREQRTADAALYIGCAGDTLRIFGQVATAWPPATRAAALREGVGFSVFRKLAGTPNRKEILAQLIAKMGGGRITVNDAIRAIGGQVNTPVSLVERATSYRLWLSKFRGQRLTARTRLALEQLRLEIDVLLGEAVEEVG